MSEKRYSQSRLMWVGTLIIVVGAIQLLGPYWQHFLPLGAEPAWGLATIFLGVAVKILRADTRSIIVWGKAAEGPVEE